MHSVCIWNNKMGIASLLLTLLSYGCWLVGHLECILLPLAVRLPLNGTPPSLGGSLWPKPISHDSSLNYVFLHRDQFKFELGNTLDECEKDIIGQMSSKYKNILFPPKLAYDYPNSGDAKLNWLEFKINKNKNSKLFGGASESKNLADCSKTHYPYTTSVDDEACLYFRFLLF
jgi:hypothetical protein